MMLSSMEIEGYKPLDYKTWVFGDKAREGVNIKRLEILTQEELKLWEASMPYQDQRDDPGHGEMTVYFALKLLDYLPGNRKIVVPAAMLHDTGWYGCNPKAWKKSVHQNRNNLQKLETEEKRRPHQNRGILIAGKILETTGYFNKNPLKYGLEIADIIGDHDTRKLPASDNGKVVRISDLFWRVTYPHAQIYMLNESPKAILKRSKETCLSNELLPHLGEVGTKIARTELVNTMCFKFPEQKIGFLKEEFAEELELIKRSNSFINSQ